MVFTKSDGKTLPDTSKTVGPANNALHSLFSSVRLSINDQLLTLNNSQFYPFKAYFSNLLTYSTDSKLSHLLPQGYATDTKGSMEPTDRANGGFLARCQWFRKGFSITQEYRTEGTTFGKLIISY